MNKVQKGLIGTAVTATVVAAVGFGTYSAFDDESAIGEDLNLENSTAVIDAGIYDSEGELVANGEGGAIQLFTDEDGLDLLPGEEWASETFTIRNDGTRAFDMTHDAQTTKGTRFLFDSTMFDRWADRDNDIFDHLYIQVDYEFSNGLKEQVKGPFTSSILDNVLSKGQAQRNGDNPLYENPTLLPEEEIEISLSIGLDEDAGNEFQGQQFAAGFHLEVEQNNEADRN
ncbi:hypothetical protein ACFO4L_13840 [Bacillus daqingensis]|uniref:Spore coat-associated protein N n=1 Tax=Bacillus daqingensis TaxID=872396 RepID=A0ABV9NZA3_9BACI